MINHEINLSVSIDQTLLNKLIEIGKKYYPKEFGGFLIGSYSDDSRNLNITATILPIKYKATKCQFKRKSNGIYEKLKSYYQEEPKRYYVGEWHTHPDNLPIPSSTDIKAINTILKHKEASIQNPILLIIGYFKHNVECGFYVPYKNKFYKYE